MTTEEHFEFRPLMTINNQIAGSQTHFSPNFAQMAQSGTGWAGTGDAIQLSRLGGVLNAFDSSASVSGDRLHRISAAFRSGGYQVDAAALGQKLIIDMRARR